MENNKIEEARRIIGLYTKKPFAACISKSRSRSPVYDLVLVIDDPEQGIERSRKAHRGTEYIVTLVSRRLFERDVRKGALGEFVAAILLEPYQPLHNGDYLSEQEADLKSRVILEELENLSLRYQNLLPEILIDPRFFFHVKMNRRAKIYPPLRSSYIRLLLEKNGEPQHGYTRAIERMVESGQLQSNGYIKVTQKLIEELPKPGEKVFTPFREVDLAIRRLATYGMASRSLEPTFIDDLYHDIDFASVDGFEDLPDPKSYLFLPTEGGLVSLDDKRGYRDLMGEIDVEGPGSIRRIGGALNFVYLIQYGEGSSRRSVVAKTFQNWYGLKWIPLSIWTVGSQNFDIIGERRLSNEYRMNRRLRSKGLNAPEVYHISVENRTIIEEFIPGIGFDKIAKKQLETTSRDPSDIANLGEEISRVHAEGISLGDSKPDNTILDREGRIWFVDLEQASTGGNPAWDLAEFLYYSGHYTLRWGRMKPLVEAFLRGYLRKGEESVVREISSSQYKRIFGVITAPHIVMGISKVCSSYGSSS